MKHTKESIKELLTTSNAAVEKGLLVLYARQTLDEQSTQTTNHQNGRGFSAFDAEILSSFACQIEKKQGQGRKLGQCLSDKQMTLARKKITRYAGQLAEVANEKAQETSSDEEVKAPEVKVERVTIIEEAGKVTAQKVTALMGEGHAAKAVEVMELQARLAEVDDKAFGAAWDAWRDSVEAMPEGGWDIEAEAEMEMAGEAPERLTYWLMVPRGEWTEVSEERAARWHASLCQMVKFYRAAVEILPFAEAHPGKFWVNYAGEMLQAVAQGQSPEVSNEERLGKAKKAADASMTEPLRPEYDEAQAKIMAWIAK